jgi:hypothetical protein
VSYILFTYSSFRRPGVCRRGAALVGPVHRITIDPLPRARRSFRHRHPTEFKHDKSHEEMWCCGFVPVVACSLPPLRSFIAYNCPMVMATLAGREHGTQKRWKRRLDGSEARNDGPGRVRGRVSFEPSPPCRSMPILSARCRPGVPGALRPVAHGRPHYVLAFEPRHEKNNKCAPFDDDRPISNNYGPNTVGHSTQALRPQWPECADYGRDPRWAVITSPSSPSPRALTRGPFL